MALIMTARHRETRMAGDVALRNQPAGASDDIRAIARPREAVPPKAPQTACFARRPRNAVMEGEGAGISSRPRFAVRFPGRTGVLFELDQVSLQCGR